MDAAPSPASVPRRAIARRAAWGLCGAILFALAMLIPRISGAGPGNGTVYHPRLFPYYFQTNIDAPMELASSLGFPSYFRIVPNRVNRPVVYGFIAGLRAGVAEPILRLILPDDIGARKWGRWTERQYLATYALWIALNLILIGASCGLAHRLVRFHFGALTADLSAVLFLSAPIVLLSAREIHLGAFQLWIATASVAFWHAVLLGLPARGDGGETLRPGNALRPRNALRPLSRNGTLAAALGIGILFLGKPCLEVFLLGAAVCVWMGQARKLPLILAAAAAPSLAWYLLVKAAGYPYAVVEVRDFGAGVWIFGMHSAGELGREAASYLSSWGHCLAEDASLFLVPFAACGAISLARTPKGRIFLVLAGLMALSDAGFYFLVHRAHAVYAMPTLAFFFVPAAEGLRITATWITERTRMRTAYAGYAAFALLLAIQASLAFRQLPHYGG